MAGSWAQPSLEFEFGVKVIRVADLDDLERGGALFVRYYVPAGDGTRRLRVDTREVGDSGGGAFWGELARFELWGCRAAADGFASAAGSTPTAAPPGGGIVFELRWRPPPSSSSGLLTSLLGSRRRPSRVLAGAELAWQDMAAASSKPEERWLTLSPAGGQRQLVTSGCRAPKLLVEVDPIRAVVGTDHVVRERIAGGVSTCCSAGEDCAQCGWVGSEEDMFLAATFSGQ